MKKKTTPPAVNGETSAAQAGHCIVTVLRDTCIWFTAISVAILLICQLIDLAEGASASTVIQTSRFLCLLPFALCAALAGVIRRATLPGGLRILLHALFSLGGSLLFLYLPLALEQKHTPGQTLLWIILFLVVYAVGLIIYLIATRAFRQKKEQAQPYENKFTKR